MKVEPLYFGCWDNVGHFVFDIRKQKVKDFGTNANPQAAWLCRHDCKICPKKYTEGVVATHYEPEFTVIAFHDRSVDTRPASNSMFLLPGKLTTEDAIEQARKMFPDIFARFKFELTIA